MLANTIKRIYRDEMFTAQVACNMGTFYFLVAAETEDDVMSYLEKRSEYKSLKGISRIDIYDGELFALLPGQKPIKRYSCATPF